MIEKPIPTTFEELQDRREELERSLRINQFNMERSLSDAGSELPKFLLKKVVAPVTVAGLTIFGITKLVNKDGDEISVGEYKETGDHTKIRYQKVEEDSSPAVMTKLWLFAAPFIQTIVKDFTKNRFFKRNNTDTTQ